MKTFLTPIVLAASVLLMSLIKGWVRGYCGSHRRHAPNARVCRRCGAPFDVYRGAAVATTAAVTSAAAANAAAANAAAANAAAAAAVAQRAPAPGAAVPVGTIVPNLPSGCSSIAIGGVNYFNCAGVYYRAGFQGNNIVYIVSAP